MNILKTINYDMLRVDEYSSMVTKFITFEYK